MGERNELQPQSCHHPHCCSLLLLLLLCSYQRSHQTRTVWHVENRTSATHSHQKCCAALDVAARQVDSNASRPNSRDILNSHGNTEATTRLLAGQSWQDSRRICKACFAQRPQSGSHHRQLGATAIVDDQVVLRLAVPASRPLLKVGGSKLEESVNLTLHRNHVHLQSNEGAQHSLSPWTQENLVLCSPHDQSRCCWTDRQAMATMSTIALIPEASIRVAATLRSST